MHKKTKKSPPSPPGKGVGGIGGKKANQRQGRWAAKRASHPQGTVNARRDGNAGGKPPTGYHSGRDCKCRGRLNAGDARGEAPCIRKLKNLPLPHREGGRGDGGKKANQRQGRRAAKKASPPQGTANACRGGNAGDKPPAGHHSGKNYKCRKRFNAGVPGAKPPAK